MVIAQEAFVAFALKLACAETLPFVLLILEAPTVDDVVDIGEISAPSVHVPGLFIGSAVEVSAAWTASLRLPARMIIIFSSFFSPF